MNTVLRKRLRNREYLGRHRRIRAALLPSVGAGLQVCARCGEPIEPGEKWHLGHDDRDRRYYSGPEHAICNSTAPHRGKTSRQW
jgi:hypothetical protein